MSIYVQLLEAVLAKRDAPHAVEGTGLRLVGAGRRPDHWSEETVGIERAERVPTALADELAYDASLVRLCWTAGIPCDPAVFRRPRAARAELELLLTAHGIISTDPDTRL